MTLKRGPGRPPNLKLREDVTAMLANGFSLKEIAAGLGFSYGYIRNMRYKWKLRDKKVVASRVSVCEGVDTLVVQVPPEKPA